MKANTICQLALAGAALAMPVERRDAVEARDPGLGSIALWFAPDVIKEFTNGHKKREFFLPEPSLLEKFGIPGLLTGNEKRDAEADAEAEAEAEAQDAIPIIFLSEEEKRDLVTRDPKGGANTAAIVGGLTGSAALVFLQSLFSRSEKRDLSSTQGGFPIIFLSEEEKRDLVARDAKGGANTAAIIGGLTGSAALVTLQQLFSGEEKRDLSAEGAIPIIFLSEEEKRDLVARDAFSPPEPSLLESWFGIPGLLTGNEE